MRAGIALAILVALTTAGCNLLMTPTTTTGDGLTVSGAIHAPDAARKLPTQSTTDSGYRVVVQSAGTLKTYLGDTDASGNFEIDLPDEESGELLMVTIVQPDSRPAGLLLFDIFGNEGRGGIEAAGDVNLGTIDFPADPTTDPLMTGGDADLANATIASDVITRVDDNGVPVGVADVGRGDDAMGAPTDNPRQRCDIDRDGMIDIFDGDDDGDGTIDDFDSDGGPDPAEADGITLNFFMNLKIDDDQAAGAYFAGDTAAIQASLREDTVITFEVRGNDALTRTITAVRVIGPPAPAPPYLSQAEVLGAGGLWADSGYALTSAGTNHFNEFVIPNAFINPGDTFTVEITFGDGTTAVYARMINYVFRSIPKVTTYGAPGSPTALTGPATIGFDGTQDLVLTWNPPVDERGNLLTSLDYRFEVFYYDAAGNQINDINGGATWTTPPANFDTNSKSYNVSGSLLTTPSTSGEFSVQLPHEIFVDTVETMSGPVEVRSYKVDVAAQNNGNNAALMLQFEKM